MTETKTVYIGIRPEPDDEDDEDDEELWKLLLSLHIYEHVSAALM